MLKTILLVVVLALAALAGFIATRPSKFRIARSRTVAAKPDVVFAYVNDFHRWAEWSPYEKLDPSMKREFSGAPSGLGSGYSWSGDKKVGEGRMTITDSVAPQSVSIRLEFIRPFTATNTAQFDFVPSGTGTNVTWAMSGERNFMAKAASLFLNVDGTVGADFEKGLARLDEVTAGRAATLRE